ncbi:MAG: bleomycin resistance protein [Phycisphaeraceae bacterium JB051]
MKTTATALYPFVPSGADFELAIRFFNALGFETAWNAGDVAGLKWGDAYFMLQKYENKALQENLMLTIELDDLEGYHAELVAMDLPSQFPGVRIKEPTDYPWGREMHIVDPAGVCWHIRQTGA